MPLTVPIITAFIVNLLHCALLYRSRVRVTMPRIVGAALAAMSLQLTIAVITSYSIHYTKLYDSSRSPPSSAGRARSSPRRIRW